MDTTTQTGDAGTTPAAELDIESLSDSESAAILAGFVNGSLAPEMHPQEPVQQTEEVQSEPVVETPPAEAEDEPEDDGKPKRMRLHGAELKYTRLIKEGLSPLEAFKHAYPDQIPAQETLVPSDEPVVELTPSQKLEQDIDQLLAQQAEQLEVYDNEMAAKTATEIAKLQKQYAREVAKEAVTEAQKTAQLEAQQEAKRDSFAQQAVNEYPDFGKNDSVFSQRAQEIHEYFLNTNDPRVNDEDYAMKLAQMVAREQNVLPVIPTKIKAPTAAPAAAPRQVVATRPGTLPTSSPNPMAPVDVAATLENLTAAELNILTKQLIAQTPR